jgi:RNA polymerase sigma factor (sigma-70 family)
LTDEEIIQKYLEGSEKGYNTVVSWMGEVVKNHVWIAAIVPDDVISDASEKLLNNLRNNKFKFESSLKTYVQRLTRYTIIDLVRSYKRAEQLLREGNIYLDDVMTPHEIYENTEEAFLFDRVFTLMSEKCRELWTMILAHKLTYSAIGAKYGKTEAAIKSKVGRCKEEAMEIYTKLV